MLGCKSESTPVDQTPYFWDNSSKSFDDVSQYRRLVGKLIYLTVTRPDISYAIRLLTQFVHEPRLVHWRSAFDVLAYIKAPGKGLIYKKHGHLQVEAYLDSSYASDKGDKKSISGYCTYVGGNLVTWRSKMQSVVSQSNAEPEYRSMAQTACKLVWLSSLLSELGFSIQSPMSMRCDNQAAIFIASNSVFDERTKYIEVDCHYVRDLVMKGIISSPYTPSLYLYKGPCNKYL